MVFDFAVHYDDLTIEMDDAIATDECGRTNVDFSKRTPDQFQSTSVVSFSPHAVSHLNVFPPCERYDGPYYDEKEIGSVYEARVSRFEQKHCWPAVILDISAKRQIIEDWQGDLESSIEGGEPSIVNMGRTQYARILKALAIGEDDLRAACAEKETLCGRIALLYTGWWRFAPRFPRLEGKFLRGRHPFLLNPYLTRASAEFLRNCGILGIGTDCYSLSPPSSSFASAGLCPGASYAESTIDNGERQDIYSLLLSPACDWLPLFECLAIPRALLHSQQFDSRSANIVAAPRRTFVKGVLAIFLIGISIQHSAVPARVLFQERCDDK